MKKLRILVISNMYPSKKSATFGIFVKNQVDLLTTQGHEVSVLAITNPNSKKKEVVKKYLLWFWKGFSLLLTGYKFDIVHVHYVFPSGVIGLFFKWIWKRKLVVTAHGGDIDKMAKKNKIIQNWTFRILSEADHVIAVGQRLFDELNIHYKVEKKKLTLLSMGVNREIFHPMKEKNILREKLKINENTKVILFVGNIIPDKGVMELLKAYLELKKQYPNVVLRLIGTIKNKVYFEELHSMIENDIVSDIAFEGPFSQADVSAWMNAADVLALPSHKEGFGLVALEAMACGLPVVGSDVGGLSYLLAEECGTLVKPKDISGLSKAIERVLFNEKMRENLMINGITRAEQHDQSKIIKKLLVIYQDILSLAFQRN